MKPRRLSRAESQAETRLRLLDAARRVFLKVGFVRATLDQIADEAGFSKGAVYSNFEGKEALFLELLRLKFSADIAVLTGLLESDLDVEGLLLGVRRYYELQEEVLDFTLVAAEFGTQVTAGSRYMEEYAGLYQEQRQAVGRAVEALFRRAGKMNAAPSDQLGAAFVSMSVGLAVQRRSDPQAISASLWGTLVERHLRTLLAAAD